MIRINLLSVDRQKAKKKAAFGTPQKMVVGCSLILVLALAAMGWMYWDATSDSASLDAEIAAAQQETTRLHSIIQQVQQFEQRKAQLQQRVVLIEQLRKEQAGPVHMLDQISKALPPMLWLLQVRQDPRAPNTVVIDGRSTTLTGLSDFVGNLEASGYFRRSVEIISTTVENISQPPGELIRFQLRAQFVVPGREEPAAPAKPAAKPRGARR